MKLKQRGYHKHEEVACLINDGRYFRVGVTVSLFVPPVFCVQRCALATLALSRDATAYDTGSSPVEFVWHAVCCVLSAPSIQSLVSCPG